MNEHAAYLGIDWADKKHDLCLLDAATGKKTQLDPRASSRMTFWQASDDHSGTLTLRTS